MVISFLTVMMKHAYIGKIVVNLTGRLNKCGVISPRYTSTQKTDLRFTSNAGSTLPSTTLRSGTNNLLPSRQFGKVVLTTSGGIMDHEEAMRKQLGGKILGFFF